MIELPLKINKKYQPNKKVNKINIDYCKYKKIWMKQKKNKVNQMFAFQLMSQGNNFNLYFSSMDSYK